MPSRMELLIFKFTKITIWLLVLITVQFWYVIHDTVESQSKHEFNRNWDTYMEHSQWSEKASDFYLINIPSREFRVQGFISLECWGTTSNKPQLHFRKTSPHYYETYIDINLNDL
jgi:hypothetical protein